jgi:hypothetical protein
MVMQLKFCAQILKNPAPQWRNIGPYAAYTQHDLNILHEFIDHWINEQGEKYIEEHMIILFYIFSYKFLDENDPILKMKLLNIPKLSVLAEKNKKITMIDSKWANIIPPY